MSKFAVITAFTILELAYQLVALPMFFMSAGSIIAQELGYDVGPSPRLFVATFIFTSMPFLYRMASNDLARRAANFIFEAELNKILTASPEKEEDPKSE